VILLLAILIVAIVPAAVVTTRNKNNSALGNAEILETTVVNGVTQTLTRTGRLQTQTRLSTAANGEVQTLTSVITAEPVTVSRRASVESPQVSDESFPPASGDMGGVSCVLKLLRWDGRVSGV
jgi:hypothetical protein